MNRPQVAFPEDAARQISLAVVEELAPNEREVALGFLEALIEMAEEDEWVYIDPRDPGGGFGASDPLFVTIIPVVVRTLRHFRKGEEPEVIWSRLSEDITKIAQAIGSKQAQENLPSLHRATRSAFLDLFPLLADK